MKVKVFSINTTAGERYGLANKKSGDVLYNATAKWKTAKGAERYAAKMGYELVGGTEETEIDKWIAVVEDGNGKIHVFTKYTEDSETFAHEVRGWNVGTILAVYREKDVVQNTNL